MKARNDVACKSSRSSINNLNSPSLPFLLTALQPVISNNVFFSPHPKDFSVLDQGTGLPNAAIVYSLI